MEHEDGTGKKKELIKPGNLRVNSRVKPVLEDRGFWAEADAGLETGGVIEGFFVDKSVRVGIMNPEQALAEAEAYEEAWLKRAKAKKQVSMKDTPEDMMVPTASSARPNPHAMGSVVIVDNVRNMANASRFERYLGYAGTIDEVGPSHARSKHPDDVTWNVRIRVPDANQR